MLCSHFVLLETSLHYVSAHVLQSGANSLSFILQHKTGILRFCGGNIEHLTKPIRDVPIRSYLSFCSAEPVIYLE